ncbi:MAG: hypothetical protein A3C35_05415 [Omnitrophica bacterium RIFCSPHIGHO2_02_FULL_46_11]|nr:MAG: hypothetical protein A3A81_02785 [Omnitrophica bacterium RIFCSPLOWO2_01_FULL_45_10b]OGW86832.1 MAG: hypothetical protein A3C35_05415 [Omnitrophica bacterium RIFCSPHIGHO2_02_FULL_46_11]
MKTVNTLYDFLMEKHVPFQTIPHQKTYTALSTANEEHVPPRQVAKAVIVKADGTDVMVVIPANRMLNLFKLSDALGTTSIKVEEEREFKELFPGCELGAMPPIGSLYDMPSIVDVRLTENKEIFFNGGTHKESVKIATADFLRISEAEIADLVAE